MWVSLHWNGGPGDVLLMRGSGRISDIGNAGGFMGHVLVV